MNTNVSPVVVKIAGYWRVTVDGKIDSSHRYKVDADRAARQLRVYGWSHAVADIHAGEQ